MGKVRLDPEAWEDGRMHGESMRPILQVGRVGKYKSEIQQQKCTGCYKDQRGLRLAAHNLPFEVC